MTMGGQMPYAMDPDGPIVSALTEALSVAPAEAMSAFTRVLISFGLEEAAARELEDNDGAAISAAWKGALIEGDAARNLSEWDVPCLVYVGAEDADFFVGAKRAAKEIPRANFVALDGFDHLQTHANVDRVLPHVWKLIHG